MSTKSCRRPCSGDQMGGLELQENGGFDCNIAKRSPPGTGPELRKLIGNLPGGHE